MVVAFAGWPDAAEAATRAIRYMVRKLPTNKLAEIDPEEYYDFTMNRPHIRLNKSKNRIIKWPANEFYSYIPKDDPNNGILMYVGTEPNLKWRTFSETVLEVASRVGVEVVVTLGALLDAVPHTRKVRVTGKSSNTEIIEKANWLGMTNTEYQGPTGIHSPFAENCTDRNLSHVSIWGHCPHYVQTSPNPIASYALLEKLKDIITIDLDMNELFLAGEAFQEEISKTIDKQPDVKSYVSKLESQYDKSYKITSDIPTSKDMVEEVEEFLRTQTGSDGQ
jgi:proteasome assembly chaperone (PAC2) family protein